MRLNQKGIDFIKQFEGLRLEAYQDVAGKWTIGYGHLIKEGEPYRNGAITEITAEKLLIQDAAFAENAITRLVTHALNPNQFAALVSLTYNIGEGNFKQSTLLKRLNNGEVPVVPGEILKWHYAGSKPISGLIRRRAAEAQLFLS